jgi:carbon starvation protein
MLDRWTDIKAVGFGSMLMECVVGVMALVAATALQPADYFAINSSPEVFKTLGMHVVNLPELSKQIGLNLEGRTDGAVTLAVGMTYVFRHIGWFAKLAPYFFQFVIMFEAVFILTAIDAGTRTARYLIQDFFGDLYKPLKDVNWMPGSLFASALSSIMWGYLLFTGNISSVWALFGVSNQLMASIGLIIGATVILRVADKRRYMLTCLVPLTYLYITVNYAGYWMVKNVYLNPVSKGFNVLNGAVSIIMLVLGVVIMVTAIRRWVKMWNTPRVQLDSKAA